MIRTTFLYIDVRSATTPAAGWTRIVFYNIYTVFKYSTKKKDLNPKMKMGTNFDGLSAVNSAEISDPAKFPRTN